MSQFIERNILKPEGDGVFFAHANEEGNPKEGDFKASARTGVADTDVFKNDGSKPNKAHVKIFTTGAGAQKSKEYTSAGVEATVVQTDFNIGTGGDKVKLGLSGDSEVGFGKEGAAVKILGTGAKVDKTGTEITVLGTGIKLGATPFK